MVQISYKLQLYTIIIMLAIKVKTLAFTIFCIINSKTSMKHFRRILSYSNLQGEAVAGELLPGLLSISLFDFGCFRCLKMGVRHCH